MTKEKKAVEQAAVQIANDLLSTNVCSGEDVEQFLNTVIQLLDRKDDRDVLIRASRRAIKSLRGKVTGALETIVTRFVIDNED